MSKISKEQIKHVAALARLEISEDNLDKYAQEVGTLIELAEELNEVDTTNVKPTTHMLQTKNVMREDEAKKWTTREDILKNAPDHKDGLFRVPSILE